MAMTALLQTIYSFMTREKLLELAQLGDVFVWYFSVAMATPALICAAYSCDWRSGLCVAATMLLVQKLSENKVREVGRGGVLADLEPQTDDLTIPGAHNRMSWENAQGLLHEALQTHVCDDNLRRTNLDARLLWRDNNGKRHYLAMNHSGYMIAQPHVEGQSALSSTFRLCVSRGTDGNSVNSVPVSLLCNGRLVELQNHLALDPFSWFSWFGALCPGESKPQTIPVWTRSVESCQYRFVSGAAGGSKIRIYSSTHKTWLAMHRSIRREYCRYGDDYPCGVVDERYAASFEVEITVPGCPPVDGQAPLLHPDQPPTGLDTAGDGTHTEFPAGQNGDAIAADVDDWTAVAAPRPGEEEAYHPELEYAGAAGLAG